MSLNAAEIFALCVCLALLPAQNQAAAPGAKPSPSISAPKFTDEQMQEMISKVQDRIRNATDQVMGRIQKAELPYRISRWPKPWRHRLTGGELQVWNVRPIAFRSSLDLSLF